MRLRKKTNINSIIEEISRGDKERLVFTVVMNNGNSYRGLLAQYDKTAIVMVCKDDIGVILNRKFISSIEMERIYLEKAVEGAKMVVSSETKQESKKARKQGQKGVGRL